MKAKNLRALLRYNFGIVWGHTPWLLIIPVAASMLVLFWNMAMASMFNASKAAQTVESLAPILSAFLCAHVLSVEYRYRISEITFSKPLSGRRILYLRLLAVYLLVAFLMAVMLFVYAFGIGTPFSVRDTVLAGIPSVLFLSMLSLMLSILLRQPMVGVALAAVYWLADAYGGVELHPLLSLQGYAAFLRGEELAGSWAIGKGILLALGIILYAVNVRLVGRPEGVRTRAKTVRNAAILVGVACLYLYTGALAKVAYGLSHEQEWPNRARAWYRDRFHIYGALPVVRLLGRNFAEYVGPLRNGDPDDPEKASSLGTTAADVERLRKLVARAPRSRWADHALYALARAVQAGVTDQDPLTARTLHWQLVQQYPASAFAPAALLSLGTLAEQAGDAAACEQAYRMLLEQYPESPEVPKALKALTDRLRASGRLEEALKLVDGVAANARPDLLPALWQQAGDLLVQLGRPAEARDRYHRALRELDARIGELEQAVADAEDVPQDILDRRNDLSSQRRSIQEALNAVGW